jgi:hypothetical protein
MTLLEFFRQHYSPGVFSVYNRNEYQEYNPEGSRLRGRPENRWWKCVQTDSNKCDVTNLKERSKNKANWEKEGQYWTGVSSKRNSTRNIAFGVKAARS